MATKIPQPKVPPTTEAAPPGTPGTEEAPTQAPDGSTPDLVPPGSDPTGAGGDDGTAPGADDPNAGAQDGGSGGLTPGEAAPDPADDDTANSALGQDLASGGSDTPGMKGTVADARDAAVEADPMAEVDATPEEQAEYDQIVSRFLLFISDKTSHGGQMPPALSVLQHMNDPKQPLAINIGTTTAHIVFILVQGAAHQKVTYSAEVLFHASDELVTAVYLVGLAAGIIKGMPPFKGMPPDGDYDFEPAEIKLMAEARMQAVRAYGTMLVKTGQLTPDQRSANQDFWKKQIDREVKSGNVDDSVIAALQKKGVFDKVHQQLGHDPGSGAGASAAANLPPSSAGTGPADGTPPPDDGSGGAAPPTGGAGAAAPPTDDGSGGGQDLIPPGASAPDPSQQGGP